MKDYGRAYAKVSLDAVRHNMLELRGRLPASTKLMAVLKSDGYGHGSVPVGRAVSPFVDMYGVALAEEAIQLREHGCDKPILILGITPESQYELLIRYQLSAAIFEVERAKMLSRMAVSLGMPCRVHIAVDTGMSRIGLLPNDASIRVVEEIFAQPGLHVNGLYTHFARADEPDKSNAMQQLERFLHFDKKLKERGIQIPIVHCANSAATIDMPESHLDMARVGIAMYGCLPGDGIIHKDIDLQPAMQVRSMIFYVKTIEAGTAVSYGGTFVADKTMTIATIPMGYGDGYPRNLSGVGEVIIRGKRARILGTVCMDQFMVDVTDIPGAAEEDTVTLLGRNGDEEITVEELAKKSGRFHYEILCTVGRRVPRVYEMDGVIVGSKDRFSERYDDLTL